MTGAPETLEAYYSRLCPGEWLPHDESKLTELALRMKDSQARRDARERTSAMPSGYVYLGQFIDHDITRDGRFILSEANRDVGKTPNFRTPTLDLDTLYGKRGSFPPNVDTKTGELPLGKTLAVTEHGKSFKASHDDLLRDAEGTAQIIDPRNDENLVVAQMQVLFTKFHNAVLQLLKSDPGLSASPAGTSAFEEARRFVTWHYQWIVLNDFLPQFVRDSVLTEIRRNGLRLFKRRFTPADNPIDLPVEFTVAAYRFGHSMIQDIYRLNGDVSVPTFELMHMTKRGEGINRDAPALPASHVIDWDFFFSVPEAVLNRGQNIDTFMNEALYGLPEQNVATFRASVPHRTLAGIHFAELMLPLPELTMRRGTKMRLPSGEEFAHNFGFTPLAPNQIPPLEEDKEFFAQPGFHGRTPLWYYLLREAALEAVSNPEPSVGPELPMQKLGHLGSRIVAEVFLQILAADAESISNAGINWTPPKFVFGSSRTPRALTTMRKMIEFVQTRPGP